MNFSTLVTFDKKRKVKKYKFKEWNNYRIAAAKRALKKEKKRAGLFPDELMRFKSIEERIMMIEVNLKSRIKHFRDYDAQVILRIKKKFKSLNIEAQEEVIEEWNKSLIPKEPFRLASMIHSYMKDPLCFKRRRGEAHPYIKGLIIDGIHTVIEVSKEDYYKHINK